MFQGVSGKRRSLVRFQYGCEKYMALNQLTIMTGGYSVEVSCSDGKKEIWKVVDNRFVEDPK